MSGSEKVDEAIEAFLAQATAKEDREQIWWASSYLRSKGVFNVLPLWRHWLRAYRDSKAVLGLSSSSAMGYATSMIGLLYGQPTGDALARCVIRHCRRLEERGKTMANEGISVVTAGHAGAHEPGQHRLEQFGEWRAELQQAVQVHGLYRCTLCGEVQESANPTRYYDLAKRRTDKELTDARAKAEAERDALIAMPHEQARAAFLEQHQVRLKHIEELKRQRREERGVTANDGQEPGGD